MSKDNEVIDLSKLLTDVLGLTIKDTFEIIGANGYIIFSARNGSRTVTEVWKFSDALNTWQPYERPKLTVEGRRRQVRAMQDFTQQQIALILGVSPSLISLDLQYIQENPFAD